MSYRPTDLYYYHSKCDGKGCELCDFQGRALINQKWVEKLSGEKSRSISNARIKPPYIYA